VLGSSSAARAGNVQWSIGISSPAVQVGVYHSPPPSAYYRHSPPPVVYHRPVVVVPQPVYVPQRPIVVHPGPMYYGQPQVVYLPQPVYVQAGRSHPGYRHGWGPRPHYKERRDRDDHRRGRDHHGHR